MAQPRYHDVELDGISFHFRMMPPDEALDRCAELQSLLLGSVKTDFGIPDPNTANGEMGAAQMGQAFASAIISLSRGLNRDAMKKARSLCLDGFTSIGDGQDAKKLDTASMVQAEVSAGTLLKLMIEAAKFHFMPIFTTAAGATGTGNWTPGRFLSVLSALKPPA